MKLPSLRIFGKAAGRPVMARAGIPRAAEKLAGAVRRKAEKYPKAYRTAKVVGTVVAVGGAYGAGKRKGRKERPSGYSSYV